MRKIHYAWAVLACCCAISLGFGMTANSAGQYLVPILSELHFGMGEYSLAGSLRGILGLFSIAMLNKVLTRVNIRVLTSSCLIVTVICMILTSTFTQLWQWFAIGAVMGIVSPVIQLMVPPILLSNWFVKKRGFAVGLSMTFSGIGGVIMNPILAWLIESYGWRTAYVINAVIVGAVLMPFFLFVITLKPSDKGLKPYGYEEEGGQKEPDGTGGASHGDQAQGVLREDALRSPSIVFMFVIFVSVGLLGGYSQLLTAYGISLGLASTLAAVLPSLSMAGNILGKILLGVINDKFGGLTMMYSSLVIAMASLLLLLSGTRLPLAFLLTGAFLAGNLLTLMSVSTPLLTQTIYGSRDYSRIYLMLSLGQSLAGTVGGPTLGLLYDYTGGFSLSLAVGAVAVTITFFATWLAYSTGKKLVWS